MREIPEVRALKALGDNNRIRATLALRKQALCVCQIVELLQLSSSTVSKHLQILRSAGIIDSEKRGRWVYYHLDVANLNERLSQSLQSLIESASSSQIAKDDRRRLKDILQIDPETLCITQRCGQ